MELLNYYFGLRHYENGKEIELIDYEAKEVVGVQIGSTRHKLWICIDGAAVLRIKSPFITFEDMSGKYKK